ncbi:hypothetical protein Trydic_g14063 [Trypoxylus dichotomus]
MMNRKSKYLWVKGLRYAEPPVGNFRFKPPIPAKSWNGTYNATTDPPACPQPQNDNTSEDCLFLNVFTPTLRCNTDTGRKPVMVFFHPGGFYEGSCSSSVYGPQYLLDEDVVLVVPNYRLGSLGFLSTGTKEAPGNNGMKDQVAALNAGGLSVTAHLASPMSRGLFHRAIAMSGSILGNLPIYTNQLNLAEKQAQLLNCPTSSPQEILLCLNTKSAKEIGNTQWSFDEFFYNPIWVWTPVIEPDFGQERFLTEHPLDSVQKKNFENVPVMLGVTTDEFGSKSFDIVGNNSLLEAYDQDFLRVWPIVYSYERNSPVSENISSGLRKFYFPKGIDNSTRKAIADMYADGVIGFSINRGTKLLSAYSTQKVFYYLFNYHGKYTHAYYPNTNNTKPYGVSHHDDLLYLFYVSVLTPLFNTSPESQIVDKMIKIWSNFAKTGYPIQSGVGNNSDILDSVQWPPFNLRSQSYMNIDTKLVIREKLYENRYRTWSELIPLNGH